MNKTQEIPQPIWMGKNEKYKLILKYKNYQINSDIDGKTNREVVTRITEITKFCRNRAIVYGFALLIGIICDLLDLFSKIESEKANF